MKKTIKLTESQLKRVINNIINEQQLLTENNIIDKLLPHRDKILKLLNRFGIGKGDLPELQRIYKNIRGNPTNEGIGTSIGKTIGSVGSAGSLLSLVIPTLLMAFNVIDLGTFKGMSMGGLSTSVTLMGLGLIIRMLSLNSDKNEKI